MVTTTDFIVAKMAFIRDFMNSSRPASELEDFIKAFDTCNAKTTSVDFTPLPGTTVLPANEDGGEKGEPEIVVHRRGRKRKAILPVVHDGNKPNVHPRAKMVKVSFLDRNTYYGSITAAAAGLHVTQAVVKYAIKHGKTVNGNEVTITDSSELMKSVETK